MNNRGYIGVIAFVIAILFVLGITIFVMSKILNSYNDNWQANAAVDSHAKELVNDEANRYAAVWDGTFLFAFALLSLFVLISVSLYANNPYFFFVVIMLLVFVVGGSALVSNAFSTVSDNPDFANQTQSFTYTTFVMDHLALLTLFLGCILVIALFMKVRGVI